MTTDLIRLSALLDDAKCFDLIRQHRWPDGVRCPSCDSTDTVGESFELNIIAAQETGTLTGTVRPIAIGQGSMPGKLNFGHLRTP